MKKALQKYVSNLPATVEELTRWVVVGKEKIKAHQAKIRATANDPKTAGVSYKAALAEGQEFSSLVIYAEARLGEMLAKNPHKYVSYGRGTIEKQKTLPPGVTKRTSHQAQAIAANPEKVEAAIAQAIKNDQIPTPDKVYKLIKSDEAKAKVAEIQ